MEGRKADRGRGNGRPLDTRRPDRTKPKPKPVRSRAGVEQGIDRDLPFNLYVAPGHLVRRLHQIAVSIFYEQTRGYRITPVQYASLTAIRAHPGIDQRRLARVIAFDRSTIGSVVERLERRGLITRQTGEDDRRYKVLYVTQKGAELLRDMQERVADVGPRLLAPLTERERKIFLRVIAKTVHLNNALSRAPLSASDED